MSLNSVYKKIAITLVIFCFMLGSCNSVVYTDISEFESIQLSTEEYIPPVRLADFLVDGDSLILSLIGDSPPYEIANDKPLSIADIDHDDDLDIIAINKDGRVIVILNQEDREFETSKSFLVIGKDFNSMRLADLNKDDHLDLIVVSEDNREIYASALLGNNRGSFDKPIYFATKIRATWHVPYVVKDLNSDSLDDFVALGDTNISVRLGRRDGHFKSPTLTERNLLNRHSSDSHFAIGDLNGDRLADLIVPYRGVFSIAFRSGDRYQKFTQFESLCIGYDPDSILVDDFNEDGKNDLIVAKEGIGQVSFIDAKDLLFGGRQPIKSIKAALRNPQLIQLVDIDSDGYADLISISPDRDEVSVSYGPFESENLDEVRFSLMTEKIDMHNFRLDVNAIIAQAINKPTDFLRNIMGFTLALIAWLFNFLYYSTYYALYGSHDSIPLDKICDLDVYLNSLG